MNTEQEDVLEIVKQSIATFIVICILIGYVMTLK